MDKARQSEKVLPERKLKEAYEREEEEGKPPEEEETNSMVEEMDNRIRCVQ